MVPVPQLESFFARANILTQLIHSRLSIPLFYPSGWNSAEVTSFKITDSSVKKHKSNALDQQQDTLAAVTPAIIALSKFAYILKAGQALSYYGGGRKRYTRKPRSATIERSRLHFLRPQLWRVLKPGDEKRTRHLRWR
ncbi:hypothetical protein IE077_004394 [Cardiosporidium cionae]|uniref:Uncharacterized protein n=1 Tax=Cardiosporidium cionae TaxID=476202 RepID=A0ABQ7JAE9_9APIC|nr:hypothetical protein IE077_004394 [Cardiosporidium cionae]|eukprot:KAF8820978.1 hypothetical protein IE077_004394 [Cardiosporidium cionae]